MKNAVFWDIKTQFVPHRRHITSPLKSYVRFEVFTAVTMKNAVFWDVMPCLVRTDVSEERRFLQEPHGITSQKTAFAPFSWLPFYFSSFSSSISFSTFLSLLYKQTNKQTPCPLVRKRTIPIQRPPLVGEFRCELLRIEVCCVVSATDPHGR
jgi:hypothetical protein